MQELEGDIVIDNETGQMVSAVVQTGREAWERIKLSGKKLREDWLSLAAALDIGRQLSTPEGKGLNKKAFGQWCEREGFSDLDNRQRAESLWLLDNKDSIFRIPEITANNPGDIHKAYKKLLSGDKRKDKIDSIIQGNQSLPDKKYSVIYADPPWQYEFSKSDSRAIENQYPTMPIEDIKAMDIPAAKDCVLFMWATSPKLDLAIDVIRQWGFEYKTCAVWDKQKIGMGYYFRQQHELLLVATKGNLPVPEPANRLKSVFSFKRGEHSSKPHEVYDMITTMYPDFVNNRIELFCRTPQEGWDVWGNQANG